MQGSRLALDFASGEPLHFGVERLRRETLTLVAHNAPTPSLEVLRLSESKARSGAETRTSLGRVTVGVVIGIRTRSDAEQPHQLSILIPHRE